MELRSYNHLHFIKTNRGGLVIKVLNVSRGRPSLVFKSIKDIYENAKDLSSCPVLRPKDEVDDLTIDSDRVNVENQCLPVVRRRTIECIPESSGFDCSSGDERSDSDMEDLGFGKMTLKQIKEQCKVKKRKRPTNCGLTEETVEICSKLKQDNSKLQAADDECDLMVPLSSLKSKLSKKGKRKFMKNSPPTLSKGAVSVVKSEELQGNEDFMQHQGDLPALTDIEVAVSITDGSNGQDTVCVAVDSQFGCNSSYEVEVPKRSCIDAQNVICVAGDYLIGSNENVGCSAVEIPEPHCSYAQNIIHVAGDSLSGCNRNAGSYGVEATESDCSDANSMICVAGDSSFGCNQNEGSFEVEAPVPDYSDAENMLCVASDTSFRCKEKGSDGVVSGTVLKIVNECAPEVEVPLSFPVEPEGCLVDEGHVYLEPADSKSLPTERTLGVEVPLSFLVEPEDCLVDEGLVYLEPADSKSLPTERTLGVEVPLSFPVEPEGCLVDEGHVYLEPADSKSLPTERTSGGEIMGKYNPELTGNQCSELPIPECKNEGCITHPMPNDFAQDAISPTKNCSDMHDNSESYSSTTMMSCLTETNPGIEVSDVAIGNSLQNLKLSQEGGECVFADTEDDLPSNVEANAISIPLSNFSLSLDSDPCSKPDSCSAPVCNDLPIAQEKQPSSLGSYLASVNNDSPTAEEKQSLLPAFDAARDCSSRSNHSAVTDELVLHEDRNCECTHLQHPPQRLFSARKSISPTCRKRLCKAMESDGCYHKEHQKCSGELCFGKQTANENSRVGSPNQIRRVENAVSPNQIAKKPKCSPPKGTLRLKVSHLSRPIPALSSGCDSIQICSENAIAFSQQQMRDIERIATRLTEELKSMKDIVEARLSPQVSPTKSSKYVADEVRMAIANARKAEETTQRWLTMMAKDCKRFCKIMSMTEKGSAASVNANEKGSAASGDAIHKERKITFADEVGGKLCHVKVFEDNMASLPESSSDKQ